MKEKLLYVVLLEGELIGVFDTQKKLDNFLDGMGDKYEFDIEEIDELLNSDPDARWTTKGKLKNTNKSTQTSPSVKDGRPSADTTSLEDLSQDGPLPEGTDPFAL
jgi:hypothetical protein